MKEKVFIDQRSQENDLYRQLQGDGLSRLQQSAGEVWTDFNAHDPGVTISEVSDYALTEMDYRLRFALEDYLTIGGQFFEPERYGLFTPLQVFPVDPVTEMDYRKLLTDRIDRLENVWLYAVEGAKGWYDVLAELSPRASVCCREEVKKQIVRLFHSCRNLCEGLRQVDFIERKPLILTGDVEVKAGQDGLELLADIYWEARQFFTGGVRYRKVEELLAEGKRPDEILEGPELRYWVMEDESLQGVPERYPVAVLFRRLMNVKGIEAVKSLGFTDGDRMYPDIINVPDRTNSYTVEVPDNRERLRLNLWTGGSRLRVDVAGLPALLYAREARCYGRQNCAEDVSVLEKHPKGSYRKIYGYDSVQHDFPECYGINEWGVAAGEPELRKAQAKQLKGYLLLYDEVFARGLKELELLPRLMSVRNEAGEEGVVAVDIPGGMWETLTDQDRLMLEEGPERFWGQKERILEMWEGIYGENSCPPWLKEFEYDGESRGEVLDRRFRFVADMAKWGKCRARGVDLSRTDPENVPGVKRYIGTLLGWQTVEEKPVVNVFPMYNVRLVEDDYFYSRPIGLLSHDLVAEDILKPEYMEPVVMPEKEYTDTDYPVLKDKLSLLRHNLLFEGLFREGVKAENYFVLNIPQYLDHLLVFHHTQRGEWINLGRFEDPQELEEVAGCLRRFLIMLNRRSETMYVVEDIYLKREETGNYGVTVVFPGWSVRMSDSRFRQECERLVCERLPAHLEVRFQWRGIVEMWEFERAYFDWRRALADGESGEQEARKLAAIL